jgi:hypothetical protein
MRIVRVLGIAMLAAGCATSGAIYPEARDASPTIAEAERQIRDAQVVGADSLATEALASAQRNLASAQVYQNGRNPGRATLEALKASADARLAKGQAERIAAEREEARARTALNALPPQGGGL